MERRRVVAEAATYSTTEGKGTKHQDKKGKKGKTQNASDTTSAAATTAAPVTTTAAEATGLYAMMISTSECSALRMEDCLHITTVLAGTRGRTKTPTKAQLPGAT